MSPEEIRRCIDTLERLVENRVWLADLPQEDRVKLLMAAGRISRPDRLEIMKLSKVHRRARQKKIRETDRTLRAQTGIRAARQAPIYLAPPREEKRQVEAVLHKPRHCYICKAEYTRLHFFYDALCPSCGDFNYEKRFFTTSLTGRTALITGGRVKIGYQAALRLLRSGARVIVTTRFPKDAASRFAREEDFPQWQSRLCLYGLDLRHSPSVEALAHHLCQTEERLDLLINNAAQTVRRPPGFYRHLLEQESKPLGQLPESWRELLAAHEHVVGRLEGLSDSRWVASWHGADDRLGLRLSAPLSQIPYRFETETPEVFPEGRLDADLQQVDLRKQNSWRLTLADVPTPEMIEVQLVNSIAPFILCARLKPLFLRTPTRDKHVVNVTAMEGIFSRHTKTDKHPHTNMAKAALNMMTLTSAPDYVRDGIHMNAVDTGWVTDEDPIELSDRKQAEHDFQPPLDIVDGAARICDPFVSGLVTGEHVWGKFLKDYQPSAW